MSSRFHGFLFGVVLALVATCVSAQVSVDKKEISDLVQQIGDLHEQGVSIHQNYDLDDTSELKACVAKYGSLRDKAKGLNSEAMEIGRAAYRVPLTLAADDAFACVYCGGSGSACKNIPGELDRVRKYLGEE